MPPVRAKRVGQGLLERREADCIRSWKRCRAVLLGPGVQRLQAQAQHHTAGQRQPSNAHPSICAPACTPETQKAHLRLAQGVLLHVGMQVGAALARLLRKEVAARACPLHKLDKRRARHLRGRAAGGAGAQGEEEARGGTRGTVSCQTREPWRQAPAKPRRPTAEAAPALAAAARQRVRPQSSGAGARARMATQQRRAHGAERPRAATGDEGVISLTFSLVVFPFLSFASRCLAHNAPARSTAARTTTPPRRRERPCSRGTLAARPARPARAGGQAAVRGHTCRGRAGEGAAAAGLRARR